MWSSIWALTWKRQEAIWHQTLVSTILFQLQPGIKNFESELSFVTVMESSCVSPPDFLIFHISSWEISQARKWDADKMLPLWVWYIGGKIETLLINQYLQWQNCRAQKEDERTFISFSIFTAFNHYINLSFYVWFHFLNKAVSTLATESVFRNIAHSPQELPGAQHIWHNQLDSYIAYTWVCNYNLLPSFWKSSRWSLKFWVQIKVTAH